MKENHDGPETLPPVKKGIYALGQLGWALTSYAPGMLLVYYYMPPDAGVPTFPARIFQGSVLGVLTVIGLAYAAGRLFDAVTDPLIAGLSDRSDHPLGRRRIFLAVSVAPFSLFSVLVFLPPQAGVTSLNTVWVFAAIIIFYWFMTMYVTPYFAWMSELGHSPKERLLLSTLISITWALGTAVGSQAYAIKGYFESAGLAPDAAFRTTVMIFAAVGFLFMLLPVIFIDERRYCERRVSNQGIFEALHSSLRNRNFLIFALSDLSYWIALTIATTGLVYYVTILLALPEAFTSSLQILMFGLSFIFYVPVNLIAGRTGKRRLLIVAFLLFLTVFLLVIFLGLLPLAPRSQGYLLILILSMPMAIFGILPNAIIADIAEADGRKSGEFKAGIFFGARTFMSKLGQMVGGILFPSLLLLGKTRSNDIGIRLSGGLAFFFLSAGLLLFLFYREREVLAALREQPEGAGVGKYAGAGRGDGAETAAGGE
jgi:Na+/melibiose symporter-like transporter